MPFLVIYPARCTFVLKKSGNPLTCDPCQEYRLNANFKNSIIFGSRRDEISIIDFDGCNEAISSPINYTFQNCIVRVDELTETEGFEDFFMFCDPCQNGDSQDPIFADPNDDDYHLDTLSIAEERAMPLPGVSLDLEGNMRDNLEPDVGCYEYQY